MRSRPCPWDGGNAPRVLSARSKDDWGLMRSEEMTLLDELAAALIRGDEETLDRLFEHEALRVPVVVWTWMGSGSAPMRVR